MPSTAVRLLGGAGLAGLATFGLLLASPQADRPHRSAAPAARAGLDRAALAFEPSAGRGPRGVDFYTRVGGAAVALSARNARYPLGDGRALTSTLVGAVAGKARPERSLRMRVNSYVGRRSQWRTGLPTYGRVRYASVYPGIDLLYHGRGQTLEYDFVAAPGSDPSRIALELSGASSLRLDRRGSVVAAIGKREIRQLRPVAYQHVGGKRAAVDASFVLDGNRVRFRLGEYDHSRALTIDPVVVFADYISSSGTDFSYDVATDGSGNAFVVGESSATVPGGTVKDGTSGPGGYVMKIAPGGTREWITYIAGRATDVAVGPGGTASFTGATGAGLATKNADDSSFAGGGLDALAGRLNADGTRNWLTYFGGTSAENNIQQDGAVAVDGAGNTYIGGRISSTDVSLGTSGAFDTTPDANGDGFVVKYSPNGARLLTTYLGGSGSDVVNGLGVQPGCSSNCPLYVAGITTSNNFPVLNVTDTTDDHLEGPADAFAVRLKADFTNRDWARYYGGANYDYAYSLAVDPSGNPSMVGYSFDICCGSTEQPFVRTYHGPSGTYVFDKSFGGSTGDVARDVATDAQGNIYVIGTTSSTDFPTTAAVQSQQGGAGDAFIVKFNHNFSFSGDTVWSTYLGGGAYDEGWGIAAGANGDVFIAGNTSSTDFPLAGNPVQPQSSNPYDGWTAKIEIKPVDITEGPEGTLRSHDASFEYAAGEPSGTYNCRLSPTEADFSSCPNIGKSYTGLPDGDYTFEVSVTDSALTTGRATARKFTIDTKPLAQLAIAPNPALVGSTVTFDASASAGASGQQLTKFEWDIDGDGNFERDTGATATTTEIFASARDNPASVRVTDAVGAVAVATAQLRVNKPPTGVQFGVTINKGAQYTRTPDVTVSANFPLSTTSMLFSNDGGFLEPTVFPPQSAVKWKLDSSGPERLPKTIYVRFLAGTIPSETFQDDIILDEVPPKVSQAIVAPAGTSSSSLASAAKAKRKWKLRVKATDSNSGVARIQVTANKRKPGRLLRYKRRLTVKSAKRPKWVRARDRAGNYSKWRKAR